MPIRMIVKIEEGQLSIPSQIDEEGGMQLQYSTGNRVEVLGQEEIREDVTVLDENGDPTGEVRNVHAGWKFFPETVNENAGGFAIEDYDEETALVWLDAGPSVLEVLKSEGEKKQDPRLFLNEIDEEGLGEEEQIPDGKVSSYAQWVRDNVSPGIARSKLISAYAEKVKRGKIAQAWKDYYKSGRKRN